MGTLFEIPRMTLSANEATPTKFIQIKNGKHRVDIMYPAGASGTVTPKQTADHNVATGLHDCIENGAAISVTGSYSFVISGPCFLGFVVSGIGGNIQVQANKEH